MSIIAGTCIATASDEPERAVLAVYMPGFLHRGPVWITAVDRTRLPLTGDLAADRRREMIAAKEAGIDAYLFDLFPTNRDRNVEEYDQLWKVAREANFSLVPIIDCNPGVVHALPDITALCRMWFDRYYGKEGILTRDGLPLVTVYDANDQTPETWRGLFSDFEKEGYRAYWVAHLRGVMPEGDGSLSPEHRRLVRDYLAAGFRGILDVGINVYPHQYGNLIKAYADAGEGRTETLAVSPWPGYWRTEHAIYIPTDGTALLRGTWESVLAAGANLFDLFSWNDFSENHQVQPTLLWGRCRTEITRHYTDKFRHREPPVYPDPHLYITFRRSVVLGEKLNVEVLRFPSSAGPVTVAVEVKSVSGVVLQRCPPVALSGRDLQAETMSFSTALAEKERVVAVHASVTAKGSTKSRFVDFVRLLPGFNLDFSTVSHQWDEMPRAPALRVDESGVAHVSSPRDCVRLQLLRNSDEVVWQFPPAPSKRQEGQPLTRLQFVLTSAPTADRQPTLWRGTLRLEGGKILRTTNADSLGREAEELRVVSGDKAIFAVPCLGYTYPGGFFVEASVPPEARWKLAVFGQEVSFAQEDLQAKKVLVWQWEGNRAMVSLVGGERDYGYPAVTRKPQPFQFDWSVLPSGGPNDVYYARAFTANGAWADSLPYVYRSGDEATVSLPYFDAVTGKLQSARITPAEALVAKYDFAEESSDLFLVRDSSGRGLHTTLPFASWVFGGGAAADPARVASEQGHALHLDGNDDFVPLPHCVMPPGALTVDLWLQPDAFDVERTILADRRFGGGHGTLCLRVQPDGRLKVSRKGSAWVDMMSERPLRPGEWQRVTVTDDLREVVLYLNGNPAGRRPSPGVGALPTFNLLGKEVDGSGYNSLPFRGSLARLRIYCAPIPPEDLAQ